MTHPLFYIMGSKSRLWRDLLPMMLPLMHDVQEYREPFVGAGSIALSIMSRHPLRPAWLNDLDPAIASLWEATRAYPDELQRLVREFVPNVSDYRAFRAHIWARDAVPDTPAEII